MHFRSSVDRVLAYWVMGVAVAILLALGSLALINRLVYGPEGQVRAYFAALREGDGAKALGILGVEAPDAGAAVLDGEGLKAAVDSLHDVDLTTLEITDGGQRATVRASYTLDGQEASTDFSLHKVGSHWGVFDSWNIDLEELPTVEVESPMVQAATLNNVKVAIADGDEDFGAFFPGLYTVTYESALFSASSDRVAVTSTEGEPTLTVALEPSDAAKASVQQQVRTYLDSCVTQNSLYPTGCPFEYDFAGRVSGNVTWTIKEYPEPAVSLEGNRWKLGQGTGVAEISFTQLDLYTGKTEQVTDQVPFKLSGTLTTSDQTITFTPAT